MRARTNALSVLRADTPRSISVEAFGAYGGESPVPHAPQPIAPPMELVQNNIG